ncbi:hypothetical protein GE061_001187 [Apolygus lucorum]|uniref:Uncharacterized protein n=1 Tax=Apolygus lucorum TaxID=248454 RepID=A0A6A4KI31_APOLU|nr:hypothetical protein GE061_001187 [Apolygus lucorum]
MDLTPPKMITANRTQNPLLLGQDIKEIAKIGRMRQMQEMRKKRIFNTKSRLIGVDVPALDVQVIAKNNQRRFEQLETEKHALLSGRIAERAIQEDLQAQRDKRRICQDIDDYRLIHQKKELSRDYDLERPSSYKGTTIGRDDERSGVTIFEGEDDKLKERIKHQRTQLKTWLLQQMREKRINEEAVKNSNKLYEETSIDRDRRSQELELMEQNIRIQMERAISEYNMALAIQKRHEKNKQLEENSRWNEMEILNSITSDLLQENRDLAKSSLGPTRINTTMYKGMPQEMVEDIRAIQHHQVEENKSRRIKDEYEQKAWDNYEKYIIDTTTKAENDKEQKLRNQRKELESYNEMLGKRQKDMEKRRNAVIYANRLTEEYFSQFNTCSR